MNGRPESSHLRMHTSTALKTFMDPENMRSLLSECQYALTAVAMCEKSAMASKRRYGHPPTHTRRWGAKERSVLMPFRTVPTSIGNCCRSLERRREKVMMGTWNLKFAERRGGEESVGGCKCGFQRSLVTSHQLMLIGSISPLHLDWMFFTSCGLDRIPSSLHYWRHIVMQCQQCCISRLVSHRRSQEYRTQYGELAVVY